MSGDVGLEIAMLVEELFHQSVPRDRAARHLLRLDLQELYHHAARNPEKVKAE